MTIDVDTICTDADLDLELGGQGLTKTGLIPAAWGGSARVARQGALDRMLEHFARLSPRILPEHISTPSELKRGVLYGAAEHLYRLSVTRTGDGEVFYGMMKRYDALFTKEMENLRPSVNTGGDCSGRAVARRIVVRRG